MEPLFHIKEKLGAWQIDGDHSQGRVQFKLFFPRDFDPEIQEIRVTGDFQEFLGGENWVFEAGIPLNKVERQEGSIWSCTTSDPLPARYYQYKYLVTFATGEPRKVSDPYARYGGIEYQNAAVVVGGSRPEENEVIPLATRKPLRDLIIYEAHLHDFTHDFRETRAPLDAFRDKLDYLRDLGFNAILFMPWTAWKHRYFDWGYEPFQYFAVEYLYANDMNHPAEKIVWLKRLISACHERDIHVILDGVFNHVSVDFPYKQFYLNRDNCPYTGVFEGQFDGLQDLDFHNQCTQAFIRDVCLYWIDVFKIDGIRFDNTTNYHSESDSRGIKQLLADIKSYLEEDGQQNFSLTLEHLNLSAATITNNSFATSYWDNALYQCCFHSLWWNQIQPELMSALNHDRFLTSPEKTPTIYIGNHDHSHVNWQAGARDNAGAFQWHKTQPYVIALLTCPGAPLIQNGQEFGEDHWIPEDDRRTGRRVVPRPLRWKYQEDSLGTYICGTYKKLIGIRQRYPALRSKNFYPASWETWQHQFNPEGYGIDTAKQIIIFHRWGNDLNGNIQKFIIVLNFSGQDHEISVPFSENGRWEDILNHWEVEISDCKGNFKINPYWGNIFLKI